MYAKFKIQMLFQSKRRISCIPIKDFNVNLPTDTPSTVTSRSTLKQNTTNWKLMVMKVTPAILWTTPGMVATTVRSQRTTGTSKYYPVLIQHW